MIYVFVAFGLALVLFFMFLTMVLLFSRPPTWYEDLPPKNWEGQEEVDPDVYYLREAEKLWNPKPDIEE